MWILDKLLRLVGTSRARLGWRVRGLKQARERREPGGSLVPEDFPLVTAVVMGLCVLFYYLSVRLSGELAGDSVLDPVPEALVRYGATYTPAIQHGEWWRTVTSIFLHGNLAHILMNLVGLWSVGTVAEDRFGHARMLVVFVVAGTVGMTTSVLWHDAVLGVGASGALFGLMGCVAAHAFRQGGGAGARELRERMVPWILFALVTSFFIPGVDNAAHVGGLAAGSLCGLFLCERVVARRVRWVWEIFAAAAVLAVALAFWAAAHSQVLG